ncbi:MAG: hypothetical protein M3Q55_16470 [Acidobacteriota bacterium]|nr:hypothetical protein [Acidobacteriota bacterium]
MGITDHDITNAMTHLMTTEALRTQELTPDAARGVDCRCGWPTRVLETRKRKYEVWRRRACLNPDCGERFTTKESR